MEMCFANIDEGYLEGILRGYRAGILTSGDYANLCQCETLDGAATHPYFPPRTRQRWRRQLSPLSAVAAQT